MNINVSLDDENIEMSQRDIDDMWNYLMSDQDNFVYCITQYLEDLDLEWYGEELRPLYEKLKKHYEKN